ncbi:MAG TPA: alpha-rhamnosidase, partial [Candidatus Parabacteroides intestinavium]|nr:alpha-rhamnosidase [Candidatus Parabacteroides intestinavium]
MIHHTLECLMIGGDMVDCPHVERLGYGGDGNASTLTGQTLFNLAPTYMNWMQAWSDCMREDGDLPHTAPNPFSAGGGPYWCGFIITASWQTYVNYGDSRLLERYYPYMKRWLEYVERHSPNGLLKKWPEQTYRNWYLGDWATPTGIDQTDPSSI